MADLLEITPSARTVKTARLGEVDVPGLSVWGLAFLVKRHPELLDLIQGDGLKNSDMNTVIDLGINVLTSFLAAGLGHPGDEAAEKACKNLGPDDVWNIGHAIIEESFPDGAQSFFNKVVAAVNKLGSVQKTESGLQLAGNQKKVSSKPSQKAASG